MTTMLTRTTTPTDDFHQKEQIPSPLASETLCEFCNQEGALLRCGQCHTFYYCNRDCQKNHWKAHKGICKGLMRKHDEIEKAHQELERVEKNYVENAGEACAICFEVVPADSQVQLPCHHIFCSPCMANYQKDNTATLKCPLCSSETSTNIIQHTYSNAVSYLQKANRFPVESKIHQQSIHTCRREFDRLYSLISSSADNIPLKHPFIIDISYLHLVLLERHYDEVISRSHEILNQQQTSLGPVEKITLVTRIAEAHEELHQYDQAIAAIKEIFQDPKIDHCSEGLKQEIRRIYVVLLRCLYYHGDHLQALHIGFLCTEMNKMYDRVYEYIAYCYRELGRWEDALAVMRKGIRYAEPWDPSVTEKYRHLYDQLLEERASKLETSASGQPQSVEIEVEVPSKDQVI
jgi:tetratricopeptide (TPR) repeat protein